MSSLCGVMCPIGWAGWATSGDRGEGNIITCDLTSKAHAGHIVNMMFGPYPSGPILGQSRPTALKCGR